MTEDTAPKWPREIWLAELDEHHNGTGMVVLSEHATVARWEGDDERDCEFHRYVDEDIYDSHAKYMSRRLAEKDQELQRLTAENADLREDNERLRKQAAYLDTLLHAAHIEADADRIKELEAARRKSMNMREAQQLMNYCAVEVITYGATISRLRNLQDAWENLQSYWENYDE